MILEAAKAFNPDSYNADYDIVASTVLPVLAVATALELTQFKQLYRDALKSKAVGRAGKFIVHFPVVLYGWSLPIVFLVGETTALSNLDQHSGDAWSHEFIGVSLYILLTSVAGGLVVIIRQAAMEVKRDLQIELAQASQHPEPERPNISEESP